MTAGPQRLVAGDDKGWEPPKMSAGPQRLPAPGGEQFEKKEDQPAGPKRWPTEDTQSIAHPPASGSGGYYKSKKHV